MRLGLQQRTQGRFQLLFAGFGQAEQLLQQLIHGVLLLFGGNQLRRGGGQHFVHAVQRGIIGQRGVKNLAHIAFGVIRKYRRNVTVFLGRNRSRRLIRPFHIGKNAFGRKLQPTHPTGGRGGLAVFLFMQGLMLVIDHQLIARCVGQIHHITAVFLGQIPCRRIMRAAVNGAELAIGQQLDAAVFRLHFKAAGG